MRRGILGIVLACAGCGRLQFDATSDADSTVRADAPPLPTTLICAGMRFPIAEVVAGTDLAVAQIDGKIVSMWPSGAGVRMMSVTGSASDVTEFPVGRVDKVAGLFRTTATTLLFVTETGGASSLWAAAGTTVQRKAIEARRSARSAIVTDAQRTAISWMRYDSTGLIASYLADDGTPAAERVINVGYPVVALSAANQTDHTHATWQQDNAGVQECQQADVDLVPLAPNVGGSSVIATDCHNPRIDSGMATHDGIASVWETSTGEIHVRYLGNGGLYDGTTMLSMRGRAPKVRFDGTRFWAAWVDETGAAPTLQVAAIEYDAMTVQQISLPGWTPVDDDSFELVLDGATVRVVVLSSDTLSFLDTCK